MSKIVIIIKNKPRISLVHGIVCCIYHHDHFRYFFLKREITFEVATFRGSLNSGGRCFRDLLTPFATFATFGGWLLSGGRYFRTLRYYGNNGAVVIHYIIVTTLFYNKEQIQNAIRLVSHVAVISGSHAMSGGALRDDH